MPDNLKRKGPEDPRTVSTQKHEIDYWCDKFDCTPEELKDAIKEVGNKPDDINDYLNQ